MSSILEKLRDLENLLKKEKLEVSNFVTAISDSLGCNVYLVNSDGSILSTALPNGSDCTEADNNQALVFKTDFRQRIGFIFQTAANLPLETCFLKDDNCYASNTFMTIVPIRNIHASSGHLLLTKRTKQFSEDELVLAETAALITSMFLYEHNYFKSNLEPKENNNIDMVLDSLSFSEIKAINNVFKELNGMEGFLVASKIADRIGISRSVIVNAMRKLESAGIVNSRSLGIKGTYIKIKNNYFLEALKSRVR